MRKGSSNYLLKFRRIVAPYIAAIYRRKLLIIISFSVFLSFAIFGWFANKETENGLHIKKLIQSSLPSLSHIDEYKNSFHSPRKSVRADDPVTERPLDQKQHDMFIEDYDLLPLKHEDMTTTQLDLMFDIPSSLKSTEEYSYEEEIATKPQLKKKNLNKRYRNSINSKNSITASKETNDESFKVISSANKTELLLKFITPKTVENHEPFKSSRLVLDTNGCKIPKLNPWDPSVVDLIQLQKPFDCGGPPLLMNSNLDGSISLNETVLLVHHDMRPYHISCSYQPVYREHEFPGYPFETGYSAGNVTELEFGVPLNEEFVGAYCDLGGRFYYQYFAFPHLKQKVEEERSARTPPEPRLNIILLGIDSVSKLNFLRHFPRTRAFLKDTIRPFSMKGYTKVGENTFPNLVPMLTGHFVEHYYNESMQFTYFFDDVDLIWKDYAKRGYRTFFAEDSPHIGTFNYLKRGFYDAPTDYYLRTLLLAMEQAPNREYNSPFCANSILETDFIYNYLKDFIKIMDTRPYIAFAMVSRLTHDLINYASYADEPTVRVLEDLWNSGALNNSALVIFSDHGIRYGEIRQTYIGKFEEKMPFMYIHFPKWFLDQQPEMAKSLETNQERLMTLFDIHATMIHLLDLNQDMTTPEKRYVTLGSSLLHEISPNRTCDEANIKQHFCPCESYEPVPVSDLTVSRASQAIVDSINTRLLPFNKSCAYLELSKILDARLNHAEPQLDALQNYYQPHTDYLLTLVTKPGEAVFDATVRYDPFSTSFDVIGISRINMYRDQSKCIDSQKMKLFCYCNS